MARISEIFVSSPYAPADGDDRYHYFLIRDESHFEYS